jgi:hypothetical protein
MLGIRVLLGAARIRRSRARYRIHAGYAKTRLPWPSSASADTCTTARCVCEPQTSAQHLCCVGIGSIRPSPFLTAQNVIGIPLARADRFP